ncbi:MAG: glycine cleavage system protein GcvH [Acidobacteriales bacterium]|nr:glycine cleavage system protein GcvH [Candidatus Koribacter versatilis]MBI3647033.1 glycine cleavage system protein GcvH [Terriglobales bacterium]
MSYPTDRQYTKEHEWITADGTIGITHYAQESLGDIVFVDLPKVGTELTAGKTLGTVESVKAVSDLYAPASGTVTEVNDELVTAPEKVNKDAHSAWMVKMKVKNPGELNGLLSAADYEKFVNEEAGH